MLRDYDITYSTVVELIFHETSALTGENVEETFLKCARSILTKIESGMNSRLSLLEKIKELFYCVC